MDVVANRICQRLLPGRRGRSSVLGVAAVTKQKKTVVIVTNHYIERYRERVGQAPPAAQCRWIKRSLNKHTLHKLAGNHYRIKLIGAPFFATLARQDNMWIAITVVPVYRKGA